LIDFRFFLISIVAVFLALGIGIVMGSGVLGGPILEGLERRADNVLERNDALRNEIAELETQLDEQTEFASTVEAGLVNGVLAGQDIVLVQAEGTDQGLTDSIETLVEEAGGDVSTRIVLSNRFALDGEGDSPALAEVLETTRSPAAELRVEAGTEIGARLGASAADRPADPQSGFARVQALELLEALEAEDFVTVERLEEEPIIPPQAMFIVAAGAPDEPPYAVGELVVPLAGRAAARGTEAMVTEGEDSAWGVVGEVRADPDVSEIVGTVDNADTITGRVAIGLSLPTTGPTGHWGTDEGAEALLPAPPG
jgi:hypothetical protein